MIRVLLDANVFLHALGADPTLRPACEGILDHLRKGLIGGEAATLMVEEIVHVRHRRTGDRARSVADGRAVASAVATLHPVGERELNSAMELFGAHGTLQARDAIHLAVARRHGLTTILSTDRGFDGIEGIRRVDPADLAAVDDLAGG